MRVLLLQAAEDVATAALGRMPSLLPCNPLPTAAAAQDACADQFLAGFGKRAYRRPLTDAGDQRPEGPVPGPAPGRTSAPTSPRRSPTSSRRCCSRRISCTDWELGPAAPIKEGNLISFNQHEVASQLSYLFWASMPDDKLFEAADKNRLGNADQIAEQARRLLVDPEGPRRPQ